ncbi:hypothetical protein [Nonomuraea typhae]|uniref:hypothetical protein n=1 Tax=Nonomuraea typhae TaxID=2603600 RepID=UPI0012F99C65|nr:hypothetical protein [Nonomuraea typhae]
MSTQRPGTIAPVYVMLALSIAFNAALVAGIVMMSLGAGIIVALTGGGTTFLGAATLVLTIMGLSGIFKH